MPLDRKPSSKRSHQLVNHMEMGQNFKLLNRRELLWFPKCGLWWTSLEWLWKRGKSLPGTPLGPHCHGMFCFLEFPFNWGFHSNPAKEVENFWFHWERLWSQTKFAWIPCILVSSFVWWRQSPTSKDCCEYMMKQCRTVPGSPVAKTLLPMQGARVWSLVREIDLKCHN